MDAKFINLKNTASQNSTIALSDCLKWNMNPLLCKV